MTCDLFECTQEVVMLLEQITDQRDAFLTDGALDKLAVCSSHGHRSASGERMGCTSRRRFESRNMRHVIQIALTMLRAGEWMPVTAARVLIGVFFCISG